MIVHGTKKEFLFRHALGNFTIKDPKDNTSAISSHVVIFDTIQTHTSDTINFKPTSLELIIRGIIIYHIIMTIIQYLDRSHLIEYINKIPPSLITEIIIIIFGINFIFAVIYYYIYQTNKNSFKNIHKLKTKEDIPFYDFIYYSHTLFFSLGYDIVPQTNLVKFFSMVHLKLGFITTAIYISKIISNW